MPEELMSGWWALVALGLCAGILSGTLIIPALVLLFRFPQKSAQGTCLAVMVPMALVGALRYWTNLRIDVDVAKMGWLAAGAVAGTLLGTELASRLSGEALRKAFAVFMAIVAAKMMLTPGKTNASARSQTLRDREVALKVDGRR